jgi:hypothetical protein
MANADHTARARPKVHFGPLSLSQQHTRHQANTLAGSGRSRPTCRPGAVSASELATG